MKKIVKQILAMALALAIAFTFAPVEAQAAGVKLTKKNSGKVSCVYYKGAKAKKASFSMTATNGGPYYNRYTGAQYNKYTVSVKLKRSNLSKNDIIRTVQESRKKGGNISDYVMIVTDAQGNAVNDCIIDGYTDYANSSSSKTLKARSGYTTYYIWNWRTTTAYTYDIYVPYDKAGVYVGFAGLRNGQLKKSKVDALSNGEISYYKAGFGKNKKGFAIAGCIQ